MRLGLLFFCLIGFSACKPSSLSSTKVTLGKTSNMNNSVVPLLTVRFDGKVGNCTGSIIKEQGFLFLLTATHCLENVQTVLIVDSRKVATETTDEWRRRVLRDKKNTTSVNVAPNKRYSKNLPPAKRSGYDFAMGIIDEEKTDPEVYSKYKKHAMSIGYDVDVSPDNLKNKIRYVGAGLRSGDTELGELREGRFNIEAKGTRDSRTIVVDSCSSWLPCAKTRPGDSGSPLIYKDPDTNEKKVIGVLYGGRTPSESLYANLGGNRFRNKIRGIIDQLSCGPSAKPK